MQDIEALILVHARENRRKCSVEPLRCNPAFRFVSYARLPGKGLELSPPLQISTLQEFVRLGFGGPVLTVSDRPNPLLVLDGTWRHAKSMEAAFAATPVRSLPRLKTAYPRVSKVHDDPLEGLATIEAIYAAFVLTGRDPTGLLDHYFWKDQFLAANSGLLRPA